jgi:hypothetical protein
MNPKKICTLIMVATLPMCLMSCDEDGPWSDDRPSKKKKPTEVGLVSYYDFQGNADDKFGTNEGIEFNTAYLENTPKVDNKVLLLNGLNSYVDLQTPFDYEEMTISVWFNAQKFNSVFDLIYTSDHPGLEFGLLSIATRNDNGVNNLYFNVSGQNVTVEIDEYLWYHVTIVKDKKQYKYYLNNVLIEAGTFDNYLTSTQGSASAIVGAVRTLQGGFFDGFIDNLRIYNRVLTAEEIEVLYKE